MRGLYRHRFRRTTLLLVGCVAVVVGLALGHRGPQLGVGLVWPGALLVAATFRRRGWLALLCFVLLGLSLGSWRGGVMTHRLAAYDTLYRHKTTLLVVAQQDAVYDKHKQLSFDASNVQTAEGKRLPGKIAVTGFGLTAVYAGDELLVDGSLRPSLGSYQGRLSFATLQLVRHHNTPINELRRRFGAAITSVLPEPLGPFGMGLLIGQRNTLPAAVSESLLMVGLTHIIAVSGYNLTILLRASAKLTGKRSRRLSMLLSLGLIATFLLLSGTSASIVRAAIVSTLSLLASFYGRQFRPLLLIMLVVAMTGLANPAYVWSDSSWYLSFLAFFGVMVVAPQIQSRWPPRLRESLLVGVVLESISAEIMTLPYILHVFGQMSFCGLLANVLVTTLVPLAMLFGTVAGLAGLFLGPVAGWFAWPARLLLTYMLDTTALLSRIPHVFVEHIGFSALQLWLTYGMVALVTWLLHFKSSAQNGMLTDSIGSKVIGEGRANVGSQQMVNYQA